MKPELRTAGRSYYKRFEENLQINLLQLNGIFAIQIERKLDLLPGDMIITRLQMCRQIASGLTQFEF